jgi:hypothetical protein
MSLTGPQQLGHRNTEAMCTSEGVLAPTPIQLRKCNRTLLVSHVPSRAMTKVSLGGTCDTERVKSHPRISKHVCSTTPAELHIIT